MLPIAVAFVAMLSAGSPPEALLVREFSAIKGDRVKLVRAESGAGTEMDITMVGTDAFCGEVYDGGKSSGQLQCVNFASISVLQLGKANQHRVYFINGPQPQ